MKYEIDGTLEDFTRTLPLNNGSTILYKIDNESYTYNPLRKVRLVFFKESGKFYTEETKEYNRELQVYEIVDDIKENEQSYKGMHILLDFAEDDDIGYPCMILAEDRKN